MKQRGWALVTGGSAGIGLEVSRGLLRKGYSLILVSRSPQKLKNAKYELDDSPIDSRCDCPVCRRYSRAYLHHLFKAEEILALRLSVMHNLYFYNRLMERIREALDEGRFSAFRAEYSEKLNRKI